MCQGGFLCKSPSGAWEFLEDLAEKTMQWEIIRDDNLNSRYSGAKGGMHVMYDLP